MKLIKSCTTFEKYQKNIFSTKSNSYFRRRYKSWLDKSNIWKSLACWLRILISNQKKTAISPKKIAPNISIRYVTKYVCNLPWIEKCDCIKEKNFFVSIIGWHFKNLIVIFIFIVLKIPCFDSTWPIWQQIWQQQWII